MDENDPDARFGVSVGVGVVDEESLDLDSGWLVAGEVEVEVAVDDDADSDEPVVFGREGRLIVVGEFDCGDGDCGGGWEEDMTSM